MSRVTLHRISLDPPGPADSICGVATLTPLDMAASKLLANSDRWADDGTFSGWAAGSTGWSGAWRHSRSPRPAPWCGRGSRH